MTCREGGMNKDFFNMWGEMNIFRKLNHPDHDPEEFH